MKKMMTFTKRVLFTTLLALGVTTLASAQPTNDDCINAIPIDVNAGPCEEQTFTVGTTIGATDSSDPSPACANYRGGDVWFSVVVPASGEIVIRTQPFNAFFNAAFAVYSGSCGSLTLIACDDDSAGFPDALIQLGAGDGVSPGEMLLVRAWEERNNRPRDFAILAYDPAGIVAAPNDNCAGAIALTVTDVGAPFDPVEGCLFEATDSGELPIPDCRYEGLDLWYSVVVPASGYANIEILASTGNTAASLGIGLYAGSCGSLTYFGCGFVNPADSQEENLIGGASFGENYGLNPGDVVLIRIFDTEFDLPGAFSIRAYDAFDNPPASDLCSGAIPFEVSTDPCDPATIVEASSEGALSSATPGEGCAVVSIGIERDIWFSAEIPASGQIELFINPENFARSFGFSIEYLIGSCDDYTVFICDGDAQQSFALTPGVDFEIGDFLFVRAISRNTADPLIFSIAAYEPNSLSPPANDLCVDAEPLTVNAVGAPYEPALGCNFGATDSGVLPIPTCGDYNGGDVWYTVVMPASGYLEVITSLTWIDDFNFFRDVAVELYSGTCDDLSVIECDAGGESTVVAVGEDDAIEPGTLLYIRVWDEDNDANGLLFVAAFDAATANPPANDLCVDAPAIPVQEGGCALDYTEGTFVEATGSGGGDATCSSYEGADVWYTVTVPASETLTISTRFPPGSVADDTGLSVYSGDCDNRIEIECDSDSGLDGASSIALTSGDGITAGQTLLLRVWPSGGEGIGRFWIAAFEPTAPVNDECIDATVLNVAQGCDQVIPQEACNEGATLSVGAPDVSCGGNDVDFDIWYAVTVPFSGELVVQMTDYRNETEYDMEIYTGTCGSLTAIACDDESGIDEYPSIELGPSNGIAVGQTLFVRIWDNSDEGFGSVLIYAFDPAFLPANDECIGAMEIPVSLDGACLPIQACNNGATASPEGDPDCAADVNYAGGDVWFSMIVPASGTLAAGLTSDLISSELALYTGECGNLVEEVCLNSSSEFIGSAGLTPGETVYLRMWTDDNEEQGIFEICAFSAPDPPACTGSQYDQLVVKDEFELREEGDMINLSFTNTTANADGGILYISAIMELNDQEEFAILTEEGGTMLAELSTLEDEGCSYTILSVPLTGAQLNAWAVDGSIDFMLNLPPEVMTTCNVPDTELSARLVYCQCELPTTPGLPCGFTDSEGIGCTSGSADFDEEAQSFSLTTIDCAPNTMLYLEDELSFVSTELCGDGEITILVTGVEGTGFAGAMLRESELAGAKKMALGTNTINRLRREVRVVDNYPSSAAPIASFNQFWIRVRRAGDVFSAFASSDGIFWQPYLSQVILMEECILAGIYTYGEKAGNEVTATFENVTVTGLDNQANLGASDTQVNLGGFAGSSQDNLQGFNQEGLKIFPNPTSGELNLDLSNFLGEAVDIRLFNSLGQFVYREQVEEVQVAIERLDVSHLEVGVYQIVMKIGNQRQAKRIVIARP